MFLNPGQKEEYKRRHANLFPELTAEVCIGCGSCVKCCPMDCISLRTADEN